MKQEMIDLDALLESVSGLYFENMREPFLTEEEMEVAPADCFLHLRIPAEKRPFSIVAGNPSYVGCRQINDHEWDVMFRLSGFGHEEHFYPRAINVLKQLALKIKPLESGSAPQWLRVEQVCEDVPRDKIAPMTVSSPADSIGKGP